MLHLLGAISIPLLNVILYTLAVLTLPMWLAQYFAEQKSPITCKAE